MCQLLKRRSSAMTGKVAAISFVLIFCFAECAADFHTNVRTPRATPTTDEEYPPIHLVKKSPESATGWGPSAEEPAPREAARKVLRVSKTSSCLSYGHSCWGAHGKRNGADTPLKDRVEPLSDTRWVLSRLVQAPLEMRSWKNRNEAAPGKHQIMDTQIFNANEGQDEQDVSDVQDVLPSNEDVFYLDDPSTRSRLSEDKLRLFKLMKKNYARLN